MFIVLCESPFCQNLDRRDLWHKLQNFLFLCDYWTKADGVFAEMQISSHSFIILKYSLDWFNILNVIDAESPMVIIVVFFGGGGEDNWYLLTMYQ